MDLHAWITQQIEHVEETAQRAVGCTTARRWEAINSLIVAVPDDNTAGPEIIEAAFHAYDDALIHAAANDPATLLRRCEADRRILNRHRADPKADRAHTAACDGCGYEWVQDHCDPLVDNLNDCPELLDLAHAHGITPDVLAGLDQPQPPAPEPLTERYANGGVLTPPITTRDVPAALRGPRWKP